jgi:AcrR family transcriptional regulator
MTRREQAEASRTVLVQAAREAFTEQGYDDATVADILRRAGMARGALYHYFPGGKREIFGAVFDELNADFHARRDAQAAESSPLDRISAAMRVFLEQCTDADFARIALVDAPRLVSGQAEPGSSYRLLVGQLDEAVAAGEAGPFPVEPMAMALYGAVRQAGELVMQAPDPAGAVDDAARALRRLVDGLRAA